MNLEYAHQLTILCVVTWIDSATLMRPERNWRNALFEMAREFEAEGDPRYPLDAVGFEQYLTHVARFEDGSNLPPERVRQSEFWLVHEGRLIGGSRLRYELIPVLERNGGNLGYDIRSRERRKGYGHRILQLSIAQARSAGLTRMLLTCEADNIGSIRIIEAAGGVETEGSIAPQTGIAMRRFWIELGL